MKFLPNFLIIGAAKSGTTALYHYLKQHPDVFLTPIKETNFFALDGMNIDFKGPGDSEGVHRNSITNITEYSYQFSKYKNEKAIGEVCPSYLYSENAPKNIKKYIPDVKIIAILREPVDRAFSAWLHLTRDKREYCSFDKALNNESRRIQENWAEIWHYKEQGMYYKQLRRYYDVFTKENIKVFFYNDFKNNPKKIYSEICDFIGVNNAFNVDMDQNHNRGGLSRNRLLYNLMMQNNFLKTIFNFFIRGSFRKRIKLFLDKRNLTSLRLDPNEKMKYKSFFEDDIRELEKLLKLRINNWK